MLCYTAEEPRVFARVLCARREEGNLALLRKYSTRISLPVGDSGKNPGCNKVHVKSRTPDRSKLVYDGAFTAMNYVFILLRRNTLRGTILVNDTFGSGIPRTNLNNGITMACNVTAQRSVSTSSLTDSSDLSLGILNEITILVDKGI